MHVDQFEVRLARVRHRFATALESKISDAVVSADHMTHDGHSALEYVSKSYRELHNICGIGPTVGFTATGDAASTAKVVEQQVLTEDIAPSILEICRAPSLRNIHGKSFVKLVQRGDSSWRKSWFYEYNYEKQFPYTPNVRGVRTDQWKYIHYPHGDGSTDRASRGFQRGWASGDHGRPTLARW